VFDVYTAIARPNPGAGPAFCLRLCGSCATAALWIGLALTPVAAFADPGVSQDKIVFGQVAALEGPAAALGRGVRTGILAAFAEANAQGGVRGRKLELISRDDGYEPTLSLEKTKALIDDGKVFALIGPVGTPTTMATEPLAAAAGVPVIGPFTGAEFLRSPDKTEVVNIRASYFEETEAMVDRLTADRGVTRIAILYQDDAFGRAGLAGVQRALDKRAMSLAAEGTFARNTTAVKMGMLAIRKGDPEAVIVIGPYQPAAAAIKLARLLKMRATFVNISFVGSDALAQELGPEGAGVLVTQVVPLPWDESIPVVERYQSALKLVGPDAKPGFVTLEGYLDGRLAIAALEKIDGEPTRKGLLETVYSGEFDFHGVKLFYSPGHNQGSDNVFLTEIRADGSFKALKSLRDLSN
jgi:branched-chain amino acid transport system substrate-binding protein